MREKHAVIELRPEGRVEARLDVVVPFTTPRRTAAALRAALRFSDGLNARVRVVRVQVVPYPLGPRQSPVPVSFLREQIAAVARSLDARCGVECEVRLAREFEAGLMGALRERSIAVLAGPWRPWPTRTGRLAARLRKDGATVFVVRDRNA